MRCIDKEIKMKKLFGVIFLVLIGCGGGSSSPTNLCNEDGVVQFDLTNAQDSSVIGCDFEVNSDFTACSDGEDVTLVGFSTDEDLKNCTIELDQDNIVGQNFYCAFDVVGVREYTCYAGIEDDGTPSGSMYCISGEINEPDSDCNVTYE